MGFVTRSLCPLQILIKMSAERLKEKSALVEMHKGFRYLKSLRDLIKANEWLCRHEKNLEKELGSMKPKLICGLDIVPIRTQQR